MSKRIVPIVGDPREFPEEFVQNPLGDLRKDLNDTHRMMRQFRELVEGLVETRAACVVHDHDNAPLHDLIEHISNAITRCAEMRAHIAQANNSLREFYREEQRIAESEPPPKGIGEA